MVLRRKRIRKPEQTLCKIFTEFHIIIRFKVQLVLPRKNFINAVANPEIMHSKENV